MTSVIRLDTLYFGTLKLHFRYTFIRTVYLYILNKNDNVYEIIYFPSPKITTDDNFFTQHEPACNNDISVAKRTLTF